MTTSTTAKNKTAAPAPKSEVVATPDVDVVGTLPVVEETPNLIPAELQANPILVNFCERYLEFVTEATAYNKAVLSQKDSDWTPSKVLVKAREIARPTDANVKPNENVKSAIEAFEQAATALNLARKNAVEVAAKELGITLTSTVERNAETEAPLKEKRKLAVVIGSQLMQIAEMTNDKVTADAVVKFFAENPLPAIGRDQAHTFDGNSSATPKYRVTVLVTDKEGNEKLHADGFTKAAQGLTKFYDRGQAPKSEDLRAFWEKAGNSAENTPVPTVEFEDVDAGLRFSIIKK
jgi:hypothetical protein